MDKNDRQYQRYMQEVKDYLTKVRNGRRVPAADPQAPQYSQPADDLRLMQRGEAPAGYGATSAPLPTYSDKGFAQAFETPAGQSSPYGFRVPNPVPNLADRVEGIRKFMQHPLDNTVNYVQRELQRTQRAFGDVFEDPVAFYKKKYGITGSQSRSGTQRGGGE